MVLFWYGAASFALGIVPWMAILGSQNGQLLYIFLDLMGAVLCIGSVPLLVRGARLEKDPARSKFRLGKTIVLSGGMTCAVGMVMWYFAGGLLSLITFSVGVLFIFVGIPVLGSGYRPPVRSPGYDYRFDPASGHSVDCQVPAGGYRGPYRTGPQNRLIPLYEYYDLDKYCYIFPGIVSFFYYYLLTNAMYDVVFMRFFIWSGGLLFFFGGVLIFFLCPCTCGRRSFKWFSWGGIGAVAGIFFAVPLAIPLFLVFRDYTIPVSLMISTSFFSYLFHSLYHKGKLGGAGRHY